MKLYRSLKDSTITKFPNVISTQSPGAESNNSYTISKILLSLGNQKDGGWGLWVPQGGELENKTSKRQNGFAIVPAWAEQRYIVSKVFCISLSLLGNKYSHPFSSPHRLALVTDQVMTNLPWMHGCCHYQWSRKEVFLWKELYHQGTSYLDLKTQTSIF